MKAHPIWAVTIEGFTTRLGFGMVTFALPLYALQLGMSLAQVGLLVGAKALIEPAVKPLMGAAVDRWGARRGYLAAVTIRLVASVLLLGATSPALLYGVRLVQGAASAARDPASMNVVAASTTRRLGRTFSLTIGAKDLGNVAAGAVGGAVLAATGGNFGVLWTVVVGIAVVPVVAVWLWIPDDRPTGQLSPERGSQQTPETPTPRVLRDRRLRVLCAFGLMTGLTAHMTHGLFPIIATEVAGLTVAQIGFVYSLSVVVLLVVGPAAGWCADHYGPGRLAGTRGLANALASITYLVVPSFGGVLAGRIVDDTGKAAFRPTWGAMIAATAQRSGSRRGRVMATLDTALSVGEALGPMLAALLWDVWGLATFLILRAVLGIATELVITRRLEDRQRPRRSAGIVVVRSDPADHRNHSQMNGFSFRSHPGSRPMRDRRTMMLPTKVLAVTAAAAAAAGLTAGALIGAKPQPPDLGDPIVVPGSSTPSARTTPTPQNTPTPGPSIRPPAAPASKAPGSGTSRVAPKSARPAPQITSAPGRGDADTDDDAPGTDRRGTDDGVDVRTETEDAGDDSGNESGDDSDDTDDGGDSDDGGDDRGGD